MQKLELTINQTMGVITGNFEDIKKSLETEMAVYETKQFVEEDKQKAKGDLADLRKLKKAVNDRKVEAKKEYMKPCITRDSLSFFISAPLYLLVFSARI